MRTVIAIDSFKGSLTSMQAGNAAAEGIHRVYPDAETVVRPLADGGEGTVEALISGMNGELREVKVTGPCGSPVIAGYGIIGSTKTAVMEMSAAAGLTLVPPGMADPMHTTTYGVGEMIRDAAAHGCRDFIIGIGGSATNDGGAGMLQALGFGLLNGHGEQIPFGSAGLAELSRISDGGVMPELAECRFRIACDVTNPLCGSSGCSAVFAPQKGARPEDIPVMDKLLGRFAALTKAVRSAADPGYPGAGAAGGLGFAFLSYTNAAAESGVELILRETRLEEYIRTADIVITGEGRLDAQTAMGKAPAGVAELAKRYGKPVIAFAGSVTKDAAALNSHGIDAFFPIIRGVCSLGEAMKTENAENNLADSAEQVFRTIRAVQDRIFPTEKCTS